MSRFLKSAALTAVAGMAMFGSAGVASADAGADAAAIGSPGVLSGNVVQAPIHIPINICGNTVNIVGLLNPTFGNTCINSSGHHGKQHHGKQHHGKQHHGKHEGHHGKQHHGKHHGHRG
ncbi:chaplin [Streptomyces sp. H27-D2]|uniref:chaplin n=1 Tax=Streptomyces sp. H27-D2 TaxID=3046304 RepID=UPI002DB993D4|nr:chaplin [Streptomyces sp. H27-D2]MEC4017828.1 chaplin [Streptomyces sp. H27-D2]